MTDRHGELKSIYDDIAKTGDLTTTACDFHLRDLEIDLGLQYIREGDRVLDAGCGPGVSIREYASKRQIDAHAIDYSDNMIEFAKRDESDVNKSVQYQCASVLELPYEDESFDVVTTHRCLMALLDWELQKDALLEIKRVLKPGGTYVMMEGTFDGLQRLNFFRRKFDLPEIEPDGRDRLHTLKFHESELRTFCKPHFEIMREQRFGMYYFLTRIVHPMLVAPDSPRYDNKINEIAKVIARQFPGFENIGHLVGFILRKRTD